MYGRFFAPFVLVLLLAAVVLSTGARATTPRTDGIRYADVPVGAYSVVAEVRAKVGKEAELRRVTLPLIALVRDDPKNLAYFLQEDRETPGRFVFYEIFATREDFEAHNAMPYVKAWLAKLPELADGGVTVTRLQIMGTVRP